MAETVAFVPPVLRPHANILAAQCVTPQDEVAFYEYMATPANAELMFDALYQTTTGYHSLPIDTAPPFQFHLWKIPGQDDVVEYLPPGEPPIGSRNPKGPKDSSDSFLSRLIYKANIGDYYTIKRYYPDDDDEPMDNWFWDQYIKTHKETDIADFKRTTNGQPSEMDNFSNLVQNYANDILPPIISNDCTSWVCKIICETKFAEFILCREEQAAQRRTSFIWVCKFQIPYNRTPELAIKMNTPRPAFVQIMIDPFGKKLQLFVAGFHAITNAVDDFTINKWKQQSFCQRPMRDVVSDFQSAALKWGVTTNLPASVVAQRQQMQPGQNDLTPYQMTVLKNKCALDAMKVWLYYIILEQARYRHGGEHDWPRTEHDSEDEIDESTQQEIDAPPPKRHKHNDASFTDLCMV